MDSENPTTIVAENRVAGQQKIQTRPGQKTTHIKNIAGELIAWDAVRAAFYENHLSVPQVAEKFNLKRKTLYEKCNREGWKHVKDSTRKARVKLAERVAGKIIKMGPEGMNWTEAGETHRQLAFEIAHASVAKFKPRAPKNFRELEAADKMARRAAGLETAEVLAPTLIQVNELINEAEPQVFEAKEVPPQVTDAEVVETIAEPSDQPSAALPAEPIPQSAPQ
jgi:hypothetical protein